MMKTVSDKEKFIWNMMGSLANALSTLVLTICVNRILGGASGGLFAFAYANAQLMLTIGLFEVRPYQSTDIDEKYSFNAYFTMRIVTCALMFIISVMYVFVNGFNMEKSAIIVLLVMFKMVEAFTDVYGGRFQQKNRIDLSGKLFFVRVALSTVVFAALAYFTKRLVAASAGMFFTSFLLFFIYDNRYTFADDKKNLALEIKPIFNIVRDVLPLFIGSFILMYISNAPKYAIERIYDSSVQNVYGILFMPAFAINLFSVFIFRPLLISMAERWNSGKLKSLAKIVLFMYVSITCITLLALIVSWLLGIPILSLLYNIDLDEYRMELQMVMFIGGLSALMSFASNVIVVMRKQKYLMFGYIIAFVFSLSFPDMLVKNSGIDGAILSYGLAVGLLVIVFTIIIICSGFWAKKLKGKKAV